MKLYRIKIYCSNCNAHLYDYDKDQRGQLIKCYKDMIVHDFTRGDLKCPECGKEFARDWMAHGCPANKIIQGRTYHKGSC